MTRHDNMFMMALLALFFGCTAFLQAPLAAQDRIPREYTNPEEIISFDRQTPFEDAIEVIDRFAQDFEGRFVINRTNFTGPISVNLPPMHWKDALSYILRVQNMVLIEEREYYEILTRNQAAERELAADPSRPDQRLVSEDRIATTRSREVRINATFFEGNRRALREIGVDWSTLTSSVPANISDFISEDGSGQLPSSDISNGRFVQVNARGAQSVSQNVFSSLINFGEIGRSGIEVQALFSAFEADNLGEVLATPSVKVMDGEQGRIQVGEDFSIKQRDFAGNVTDEFFSTGTILRVTPQIISDRDTTFIYLELEVERSAAQPDPVSTIITKEEASTHTLLLDGESTVIAGLFRTDRSEVRRGIPILKDLPGWFFGLKYLFGYNSTDISQNELIVIVQAELERSIPERMAMQLQSRRQALEQQQEVHRAGLDYLPERLTLSEAPEPLSAGVEAVSFTEPDSVVEAEEAERLEEETAFHEQEVVRDPVIQEGVGEPAMDEQQPRPEEEELISYSYFTIGGSFVERQRAMTLFREFREQGYDPHLLYNAETGYYFVAYRGFTEWSDAASFTQMIRGEIQPDAWLSRITTEEELEME